MFQFEMHVLLVFTLLAPQKYFSWFLAQFFDWYIIKRRKSCKKGLQYNSCNLLKHSWRGWSTPSNSRASLVWQSYLVSDSLRAVLKPSVLPCNSSLFGLDTETRWSPVPCQGKPCKSILVSARAETRGGEACDTCTSSRAKSGEAGTHLCWLKASKSQCGGKVWILLLGSWASYTKILNRERALHERILLFVAFETPKTTTDTKELWFNH